MGIVLVGQIKLRTTFNDLIQKNKFPQVVLLEGPEGCGKHTLVTQLGKKLNILIQDITTQINLETINNIIVNPIKYIYLINCDKITSVQQNTLLKLLEEPPTTCYIILLCKNINILLPTIINRCQHYMFSPYTQSELTEFTNGDTEVLKYANTPGLILQLINCSIEQLTSLCEKIFLKIQQASYSNVLTISNKLDFSDQSQEGKFNFSIFVCVLKYTALKLYTNRQINYKMWQLCNEFTTSTSIRNINFQYLLENFLINLKLISEAK